MKNNAIRRLTIISLAVGAVNLIVSLLYVLRLPDEVPTHFDAGFKCDGVGSRWLGMMVPVIIMTVYMLGLFVTAKSKNAEKNIKPLTVCLLFIELMLVGLSWFMLIIMNSGAKIGDKIEGRFILLEPLMVGLMFVIIGNYMPIVRQNRNLGIKLPWTLKNERCWDVTHRVAGRIWVVTGIIMLAGTGVLWLTAADSIAAFLVLLFVPITAAVIIPSVYSYQHRND